MRNAFLIAVSLLWGLPAGAEEFTLDRALETLEQSNEDWQAVEARVQRSRALRREAMSRLLPQVSAGASTTYTPKEVSFGDSVVRRKFDWDAYGSARLTVFDGSQYPLVSAARKRVEVAKSSGDWTKRTLRFEVESAFYELVAAQRDVEITEQTVQLRQAYVEQATALERAGVALPLDVARATTQALEAQQFALEANARLGNQADALAVLLAAEPDGTLRAAHSGALEGPPDAKDVDGDRADLEAGRREIAALGFVKTSRWWSLAPTVAVQGDLRAGPPSFSSPDITTWSVTLSIAWLLYDGGARYARIDATRAELREAQLQQTAAERAARADLSGALRTWRAAFQAVTVATKQVEVAKSAYDMTRARFESGLVTSIEVIEASDALFRAESSLSSATLAADVASARWRYLR